jgi:hypothetical protein
MLQPGQKFLPENATWKYNASGSNLGTTWRGTSYNDASWSSGAAVFGFGDPVTTYINQSRWNILIILENHFNVVDADAFFDYTLELRRDDGAVVYVNGTEVWRSNMPTGTINLYHSSQRNSRWFCRNYFQYLKY